MVNRWGQTSMILTIANESDTEADHGPPSTAICAWRSLSRHR